MSLFGCPEGMYFNFPLLTALLCLHSIPTVGKHISGSIPTKTYKYIIFIGIDKSFGKKILNYYKRWLVTKLTETHNSIDTQ